MLALILTSASVCGLCGLLGSGSVLPVPETAQSVLYLVMALAATVLFGAFDAYESQDSTRGSGDDA